MAKSVRSPQRKQDYLSRVLTLGEIENDIACELIGLIYEINDEDKNKETNKREPNIFIINVLVIVSSVIPNKKSISSLEVIFLAFAITITTS